MGKKSDQGKYAENKLRTFLKKVSENRAGFLFDRVPDARSSRGRSGQRPSDFAAYAPGIHAWLEVKETKHDYLVPKKNITQIPMLVLRRAAGGTPIILTYHSGIKLWRCPPFDFFVDNQGETGSFDLREFPTYKSVELALSQCHSAIFFQHRGAK